MRTIIFIISIGLFANIIFSQESFRLEWEIEDNLSPADAIVDSEGNTIVVGIIRKVNQNYDGDGFIFKMTPEGEYLYFRYPSEPDTNIFFAEVIEINNGNYFVLADYGPNDYYNPNETLMVLVFDQELNLIIEKKYNLSDSYSSIGSQNLIVEDNENILLAASVRQAGTQSVHDLAFYRFTQAGDTLETKFIHYPHSVSIYDFDKIPGSNNYLMLEWSTQSSGDFECYILKPDLTADTINFHYSFDYYVSNKDHICDYWYPDKTFMMATGLSFNVKDLDEGLGVFRCDTLANISEYLYLNKVDIYDRHAFRQCMSYADENSIYIAGFMADFWNCNSPDSLELYVVDTALNQIAYKSLGGDISYDAVGVLTAQDKGAIIYGVAWHPVGENCYGNLVIYYVSREDLGLTTKVFDTEMPNNEAKVYPNPANEVINIRVNKKQLGQNSRIKLFNSSGRKVYDYKLPDKGNTIQLNITNLEKGLYMYEITNEKQKISNGKFIKQ